MTLAHRPPAPRWLDRGRVVFYCGIIVGLYVLMILALTGLSEQPARVDFLAFHTAGVMAMAGDATQAYHWDAMRPLQAAALGVPEEDVAAFLGWVNPPHFFFAVLPFALLSYGWGWFAWVVVTSLLFAGAVRAVVPGAALPAALVGLSTPGVLISAGVGQNGLLTAALLGLAYALLDRRPVAAGIALGLMTFKPQFGLIAPLLLAATGRWRIFAAAAVTALLAVGLALLVFGPEAWLGFVRNLGLNHERYLSDPGPPMRRIQSVYVIALLASGSQRLAWAIHGIFALCVAAIVLRLWLRRPEGPEEARAAAAIAAAFLMTPFVWLYDAPALVVAALFLARAAMRDGWLPWEMTLLVLACVWIQLVTLTGPLPVFLPVSWLVLLGCAWRRDRAWRARNGHSDRALSPATSATTS